MKLRVLSYNIHKGASLKELKAELVKLDLDLVFLQEVRGGNLAQAETLADQVWSHYAYGKNAIYESGDHGNAVLSKYPFVSWENHDLSTNTLESRGVIHGVVGIEGRRLHVMCTHLNLLSNSRKWQLSQIIERINDEVPKGEPLIVAGDFNDWRQQLSDELAQAAGCLEVFQTLHQEHAATFPVWLPMLRLDRIYSRNLKPLTAEVFRGKPWTKLSDHAPILAEFELP